MSKVNSLGLTLIIIGLIGSFLAVTMINQYELHKRSLNVPTDMYITGSWLTPISSTVTIISLFSIPVGIALLMNQTQSSNSLTTASYKYKIAKEIRNRIAQIGMIVFGSGLIFLLIGHEIGSAITVQNNPALNADYAPWAYLALPFEILAIFSEVTGGILLLKAYGEWYDKEALIAIKQIE